MIPELNVSSDSSLLWWITNNYQEKFVIHKHTNIHIWQLWQNIKLLLVDFIPISQVIKHMLSEKAGYGTLAEVWLDVSSQPVAEQMMQWWHKRWIRAMMPISWCSICSERAVTVIQGAAREKRLERRRGDSQIEQEVPAYADVQLS